MTDNTQPEALRLAEQYDYGDPVAHSNMWKAAVCNALRRQHARIAELEAQLEAIGAGGVSGPLMGRTDSKERAAKAAETWLRDKYGAYRGHFAWRELEEAFLAGRASLAASAGSEPVAPDGWLHAETLNSLRSLQQKDPS